MLWKLGSVYNEDNLSLIVQRVLGDAWSLASQAMSGVPCFGAPWTLFVETFG